MTWQNSRVASDSTHHVLGNESLYARRFDEVLKFHEPGLAPVRRHDEAWHVHPKAASEASPGSPGGWVRLLSAPEEAGFLDSGTTFPQNGSRRWEYSPIL